MNKKLWTEGQEQASSWRILFHVPLHRGFPTACQCNSWFLKQKHEGESQPAALSQQEGTRSSKADHLVSSIYVANTNFHFMDPILHFCCCKEVSAVTPHRVTITWSRPQPAKAAHSVGVKPKRSQRNNLQGIHRCMQPFTKWSHIPVTPVLKQLLGCRVGKISAFLC